MHFPGVTILELKEFRRDKLPRGMLERLIALSELAKSAYVIRLDHDALHTGADSGSGFVRQKQYVLRYRHLEQASSSR